MYPRRSDLPSSLLRMAMVGGAMLLLGALAIVYPPDLLFGTSPPNDLGKGLRTLRALPSAFGESGDVRLQVRLPGEQFEFPLDATTNDSLRALQWVRAEDTTQVTLAQSSIGTTVSAPQRAGFYRLAVTRPNGQRYLDSIVVAVLVPFASKKRSSINGYRIGTYNWERAPDDATVPPAGFIEVHENMADLAVSTHLRISDFITHDGQQSWPRYVAIDPRILDKVELVLRYLGSRERDVSMSVHSGYRTPFHNRRVPRAAGDSRHQYGDAVDLAIDVDEDGRISYLDALAVSRFIDLVERNYPQLVGGTGLYGNRGTSPYVHMDVRGERKRWRG